MKKLSLLLACIVAVACGDDSTTMTVDSGMDVSMDVQTDVPGTDTPDVPGTDTPDVPVTEGDICDAANLVAVTASESEAVSTTIDTSMVSTTPAALGASCGSGDLSGQVVLAITVPGTGDKYVRVSTENDGTADIDTVLEMRTECAVPNDDGCFDDTAESLLSIGIIEATGGETVFAVVTGYGTDDVGVIEVVVDVFTNEAPVLSTAAALSYPIPLDEDGQIELISSFTGSDADGNIAGFSVTFVDEDGMDVDVDADGTADTYEVDFDATSGEDVEGLMDIDVVAARVPPVLPDTVTQVRYALYDDLGAVSNELTVDLTDGTFGVDGESCAELTERCGVGFVCTDGVCGARSAPVLTSAAGELYTFMDIGTFLAMEAQGTDADGDVLGYRFTLIDAAGDDVDFDGDGEADTFTFDFNEDLSGQTSFTGTSSPGASMWAADAVGFRIELYDAAYLTSNEIVIDAYGTESTPAAAGEACGGTQLCDFAAMLDCDAMTNMCVSM